MPAARSLSFESAQYCGRFAFICTEATLTGTMCPWTPSSRAASSAIPCQVVVPLFTE